MKTEFKGTQGPWRVKEWPNATPSIESDHTTVVMQAYHDEMINGIYYTNQKENAQLIASAPDLLNALKDGVELIEYLINVIPTGKIRNTMCDFNITAQFAINKALGLPNN